MISLLLENYSLLNVFVVCIQLFTPLILYIVSYFFVTPSQSAWLAKNEKRFSNHLFEKTKGLFFGSISFIFLGIASLLVLDFFYRKHIGENNTGFQSLNYFSEVFGTMKIFDNLHFFIFPIMTLLSIVGRPITYHSENFTTEFILMIIAMIMNLYLIYFYSVKISYVVSTLLLPLLSWQLINVISLSSTMSVATASE